MKRTLLTLSVLLCTGSALAAWHVVPCDAHTLAQRAKFAAAVHKARPGGPLYAPKPFPATDAQVVEDLVQQITDIYGRPQSTGVFQAVAQGMRDGIYRYDVVRVADWTPGRCASAGNGGDSYFLILIVDRVSGFEVARATILETGLFGDIAVRSPSIAVEPIEPPEAAVTKLAGHGIQARDPQFVATTGSLQCDMLRPCAAARNASGIFIASGADAFLLPLGGRLFTMKNELRTIDDQRNFNNKLAADERWVSIGGDAFVVAKKLR